MSLPVEGSLSLNHYPCPPAYEVSDDSRISLLFVAFGDKTSSLAISGRAVSQS